MKGRLSNLLSNRPLSQVDWGQPNVRSSISMHFCRPISNPLECRRRSAVYYLEQYLDSLDRISHTCADFDIGATEGQITPESSMLHNDIADKPLSNSSIEPISFTNPERHGSSQNLHRHSPTWSERHGEHSSLHAGESKSSASTLVSNRSVLVRIPLVNCEWSLIMKQHLYSMYLCDSHPTQGSCCSFRGGRIRWSHGVYIASDLAVLAVLLCKFCLAEGTGLEASLLGGNDRWKESTCARFLTFFKGGGDYF